MAYTAIEQMRQRNEARFGVDLGPAQPPLYTNRRGRNDLKSAALRFLHKRCEGLRFDAEIARQEEESGVYQGKSLKPGQIPYNMEMDLNRLCLEKALETFIDSGVDKDAYAVYYLTDNMPHPVVSEIVESPTGYITPGVTPDNNNPPPIGPAGDPSFEPGDPTPEPDSEPGQEVPTCCVRTLTGLGEGQRAYTLDYCAEHGAIWKSVDALVARADTDEAKLAAWQQAIDLWTEAVRAEYRRLLAKARPEDIPTLMNEQALFFLQLSCHRDALAAFSGDGALAAAMDAAEHVMNKCADMCYERHTSPEARVDSLLAEGIPQLSGIETPERCLRDVTPTVTGAAYLEALCETHAADEALERGAIGTAEGDEALAAAWKQAKGLWLAELDALTNARYMAADEAGRKVIAAERVSFGNWLKAREAVLELLYPDHPEIVGEVITDAIRARVLSLCGEE